MIGRPKSYHVILVLAIVAALAGTEVGYSHESKIEKEVGDAHVTFKSFQKSWWFYASLGGKVEVRSEETKRRWWCVWLCKTREKRDAETILLNNGYFATIENVTVGPESTEKTCQNESDCELKQNAWGLGVSLPTDGVITQSRVVVDGEGDGATTGKGNHRD